MPNRKGFTLINLKKWSRKEYYLHFMNEVRCDYSICVNIDITNIKKYKLYPTMLYLLTQSVNKMPEFRTALINKKLGIYDQMHPAYAIFNKKEKNFVGVWTECHKNYHTFLKAYEKDVEKYENSAKLFPKPNRPKNTFDVSMVPWFSFTAFDINVFDEGKYLIPIFTMGKYFKVNGKTILPLAIQVHHAVCDAYHVGKFIDMLQKAIDTFTQQKFKII